MPYLWYTGRRPPSKTCPLCPVLTRPAEGAYKPDAEPEDSATCYQARSRPGSPENGLPVVSEVVERDLTLVVGWAFGSPLQVAEFPLATGSVTKPGCAALVPVVVDLVGDGAVGEDAGLVVVHDGEAAGGLVGAATDGALGGGVVVGLAGAATDGAVEDAAGGFVGRFLTITVFGGAAPPN